MMEYILIGGVSFFTAILTFFSGFGVGTILTPVFVLFFPIELAVAMTAIVHFLNNLFKFGLTYKDIDLKVLLKFGGAAIPLAFVGAWILMSFSGNNIVLNSFTINDYLFEIKLIELIIGIMMFVFAIVEVLPQFSETVIKNNYLIAGGAISGFFGGLSGHQGALRTMFLIRSGLSKEGFIATGIAIACVVDISRLGIYMTKIEKTSITENMGIIATATLCAFVGAYFGKKLLKKITINAIQYIVSILIMLVSLLLIFGMI